MLNPANRKENKCIFGTKKFCNAFKLIMVYDLDKGRYYVQFDFKSTLVVFTTVRLRSSITWSGDECWMTGLTINRYEYFKFSGHTEQPPSTPHSRQNSSGRSFSLFLWESGKRILISICFCSELVQWFCCSSFLSKSHWEKVSRFTTNIGFLSDIL